jgi:hypothetical protein
MPQRSSSRRTFARLALFTIAGWVLWALGRPAPDARVSKRGSFNKRRLATSLTFATLFFAGMALSAGAGDEAAEMLEGSDEPTAAETTTAEDTAQEEASAEEPAPAEEAPADDQTADQPADEPAPAEEQPAEQPSGDEPAGDPASDGGGSNGGGAPADSGGGGDQPAEKPSDDDLLGGDPPAEPPAPAHDPTTDNLPNGAANGEGAAPESDEYEPPEHSHPSGELEREPGFATVWLHRTLPDPTPPSKRLTRAFARRLRQEAREAGTDWALMLGVLRSRGKLGRAPATRAQLDALATRLAALHAAEDPWNAALALSGRTAFADRAVALTHLYHAVGLRALVTGFQAAKPALEEAVLNDGRIDIYAGGADDLANHRIDVRVLVLIRYLAEMHGQVTVSSLKSGHRIFSRPGVVSAHTYGLAVDVAGLENKSITGNQEPGGLTERAVRNILLLPAELRPKQVISLLGLGGPSFPLSDHYDHIHVGY